MDLKDAIKGKIISATPSKWNPTTQYVEAMTSQGVIRYAVEGKRKVGQYVWLHKRAKKLPWDEEMWEEVTE